MVNSFRNTASSEINKIKVIKTNNMLVFRDCFPEPAKPNCSKFSDTGCWKTKTLSEIYWGKTVYISNAPSPFNRT